MVYSISYDLNRPGQNYNELYTKIKDLGDWCHPVDSTWFVVSHLNPQQIVQHIATAMDRTDALVVIRATAPGHWTGLSSEVSEWLRSHL